MKVIWTPEAEQDRLDIWDYIATDNPPAAVHMDELFSAAAASLRDFPDKGRLGQIVGTRELIPHENYRLIYQAENDAVWILALVHVARMWTPAPGLSSKPVCLSTLFRQSVGPEKQKPPKLWEFQGLKLDIWREDRDLNPFLGGSVT